MTFKDLTHLKDDLIQNNTVNQELYSTYEVKRGLRNRDGSGVLAGLTQISSVVGSKIIDGDSVAVEGILKLRGINLMDLVDQLHPSNGQAFEKSVFLLLVGRMPTDKEFSTFVDIFKKERVIPEDLLNHVIKAIPSKDVMNKLQTCLSALYAFDENPDSIDPYDNFEKAVKVIAKIPTIIAYSYLAAFKPNATFIAPPQCESTAESFLTILREGKSPSKLEIDLLDLCLLLHTEHGGGNNSTFTTYVVTSSASDFYSTLTAACGSLKGPLHGAANKKVQEMMDDVKAHMTDYTSKEELTAYVTKIINKEAHDKSGKIYGLGHAVYTKSDPRAIVLKEHAKALAKDKNRESELQLYFNLEELGPKIFAELKQNDKVIAPNVDFFSGFVYDCLNIPVEVFTPLFAMARSAGWAAHRIEEILSGKRIIRPGYKYIGS